MWFLEHESLFGGKRVWLRPGSQQLFGRTKAGKTEEGKNVFIDHKTVSRQHMMLKVLDVPDGDGMKLHARSQVEVTDLSCRQGTVIDGEKTLMSKKEGGTVTSYDKVILSGTEHKIRLSATYPEFRIKWQPVVFTLASKEFKGYSSRLHTLDIKTSMEFVYYQTTHVVSQKRNLPKVLQGLVAGTHIVTGDFLNAVITVAAPQNEDPENYRASKLEEDFDVWWPKEKEYIPPVAAEPVPRPEQMLEPDEHRSEIFSGLTFVFLNENQYNNLHEAISGGRGKALLFHVRLGKTTVDEYVEYVRNVAGEKKRASASEVRLPVVTVRLLSFPEGMEEWATNFVTSTDRALNQRSIQQNEFLDAIVTKDAASLQKPPSEIEFGSSMPPSATAEAPQVQERFTRARSRGQSQAPETTPAPAEEPAKVIPRKRPIRRGITQSRFTGFDEYEPPTKARKIEEDVPMGEIPESAPTQDSYKRSQTPLAFGTQASRRRKSPVEEGIEETNPDDLFPAAAAIRKRRAATRGVSASVEPETPAAPEPKTKGAEVLEKLQRAKKKVSKDIDVREKTRLRLQEDEEKRKADEESLREALEGVDIADIRGLVQVEEMEIRPREPRSNQRDTDPGERWKDEWNGRKNFKKFRRRGAERGPQGQRVIVRLEEAPPKKGFGLGPDAFFLEENEKPKSKADERRNKRKTGRGQHSDSEPEPGFTRRKRNQEHEVINVEDSDDLDGEDVIAESSNTQRSRTQRVAETQIEESQTQTQRGIRKRAPVTVAAGQPPSKRTRVNRREDDSDDEETGFRFRRRG